MPDEDVVRLLQGISLNAIVDMNLPQGEGDKLILRDVAELLSLGDCSHFVKRAIQFGEL
jgi:hypothetical protein